MESRTTSNDGATPPGEGGDARHPNVARNALLIALSLVLVGLLLPRPRAVSAVAAAPALSSSAGASSSSAPAASVAPRPRREPPPGRAPLELSPDEQAKGLNECMLPDPGPGYLAPPRPVLHGLAQFPASGGHTEDMGFDVLVHFHGGAAVKKTFVKAAKGMGFVGIELGEGSQAYEEPFKPKGVYAQLLGSVEKALRDQTGDPSAHVRHVALSGWSAGYGAIRAILRGGPEAKVDAVVLLDGMHAAFMTAGRPGAGPGGVGDIDPRDLEPFVDWARRAQAGQGLFFASHSRIGTVGYASTTMSTERLLAELRLVAVAAVPTPDPLGLESYVDSGGLHLRSYGGDNERAHCDHTRHIGEAIRRYVEPAFGTPAAGG